MSSPTSKKDPLKDMKIEIDANQMLNKSKKIAKSKKNEKTQKGSSYIDKIREITGGEELDSIDLSDENLIEKKPNNACSLLDMDEKQEKSRQSARETRKRRKLYMQLLEKKVINLTEENKSLQAKNLLLENKVLAHQNSEIMTKVQNERKKLFDKLENAINSKDELEINCILDALRLRLGLAGKTRLQALSSIFSEVVNMMMPFHMKYVLWISANCLDIFREDNDTDSVDSANWFSNIGLSDKQIKDIQQEVLKQKQEYDEILLNFNQIRKNIIVQNEKSQNFIDDLRNVFPTINTAKFLLDLDRKRGHYVSDKIYPEQFWSDLLEQDFKKPMEKVPLAQLKEEVEQHMESEQLSPYINGYNQNGNQERQNSDNSFNQLSLMQQLRGPDHNVINNTLFNPNQSFQNYSQQQINSQNNIMFTSQQSNNNYDNNNCNNNNNNISHTGNQDNNNRIQKSNSHQNLKMENSSDEQGKKNNVEKQNQRQLLIKINSETNTNSRNQSNQNNSYMKYQQQLQQQMQMQHQNQNNEHGNNNNNQNQNQNNSSNSIDMNMYYNNMSMDFMSKNDDNNNLLSAGKMNKDIFWDKEYI